MLEGIYHAEQKGLRHPEARIRTRPCRNCRVSERASAAFYSDRNESTGSEGMRQNSGYAFLICVERNIHYVVAAVEWWSMRGRHSILCCCLLVVVSTAGTLRNCTGSDPTELWRRTSRASRELAKAVKKFEHFKAMVEYDRWKISSDAGIMGVSLERSGPNKPVKVVFSGTTFHEPLA